MSITQSTQQTQPQFRPVWQKALVAAWVLFALACGAPPAGPPEGGFSGDGAALAASQRLVAPAEQPHDCILPSVSIVNFGKIIYRGPVDVTPTILRIGRGERLPFPHDGTVFNNKEGRLPKAAPAYYHEYVDPTPGVRGPGPQRVLTGGTEAWFYTPDHYASFFAVHCD